MPKKCSKCRRIGHNLQKCPIKYYEGDLNNLCQRHGKGKDTRTTFNYCVGVYDGDWVNDKKEGKGIMTFNNGNKYEGMWDYDNMCGKGTMTYANGNKYDGEWKNSHKHGNGIMTYANGNKYEGEWKNNCLYKGKITFNSPNLNGFIELNGVKEYDNYYLLKALEYSYFQ